MDVLQKFKFLAQNCLFNAQVIVYMSDRISHLSSQNQLLPTSQTATSGVAGLVKEDGKSMLSANFNRNGDYLTMRTV